MLRVALSVGQHVLQFWCQKHLSTRVPAKYNLHLLKLLHVRQQEGDACICLFEGSTIYQAIALNYERSSRIQLLILAGSMSLDDAARLHDRKRNTLLAGIYASRCSNGKRRCLEKGYSEEASPRAVLQGNFQRLCSVIAGCACRKLQFKRAYAIFSVSECGTC